MVFANSDSHFDCGCEQIPRPVYWRLVFRVPLHFARPIILQGCHAITLIDRIIELEPCVRITAVKTLTMTEEYLADHFPHFPVMPGVLMLEALTQAGLGCANQRRLQHSMVVLKRPTT